MFILLFGGLGVLVGRCVVFWFMFVWFVIWLLGVCVCRFVVVFTYFVDLVVFAFGFWVCFLNWFRLLAVCLICLVVLRLVVGFVVYVLLVCDLTGV